MTTMDPKDQANESARDADLDQDIRSIRAQLGTHGETEPPALLDQAVLNAARRELAARRRRPARWIGGFATAAVLVLTLTLVLEQQQTTVPPETRRIDGLRQESFGDKQAGPREQEETGLAADADRAGPSGEQTRRLQGAAEESTENGPAPASSPAPAPPPAAPQPALRAKRESAEAAPPESGDDAPAMTPPAATITMEAGEQDAMAGQSQRGGEVSMDEAPDPVHATELKTQKMQNETKADESTPFPAEPRSWIERMLRLKETGQSEELRRQLEAFRAAYPDYPLPPELDGEAG
jgi:hypothetical protein